jgi:hypothetical protein
MIREACATQMLRASAKAFSRCLARCGHDIVNAPGRAAALALVE